ncbi:phage portal protein [Clostridium botulinum]|uniref:phage portal protein n=1 Tax=Clostridium botulinum TaxID=1491 RepID=UPI0028FC9689|nr:phage portal protein [Clostridium botulinum]
MMEWWNNIKNYISTRKSADLNEKELLEWLGISNTPKKILSEVTYFTCMKMLSETLGKMPLKFYQDTKDGIVKAESNEVYNLLRNRPNKIMTPTIFWATVENNRNHHGNAYVWIRKEFQRRKYGGKLIVKDLWIMPSNDVQIIIDDKGVFADKGGIWYVYTDKYTGEQYIFSSDEVMHFKTSMSFDGILGVSVREILKTSLEGGLAAQNFMNNLYKGGLTARMALQYTGDLDPKLEKKLIEKFEKYANGANNAGKIVPVPIGMQLQPLNIKLTDAQFFELKKYSSLQIAGAFGIKPNQINNYEKSSYSNSEMQQLSFYVDTELFIIKQYEEETTYKLLSKSDLENSKYFKFNEKVLLRTDSKSQAEVMSKYVNNGIYKPNEARGYLDLPKAEGGDVLMVNGNYIPITDVGKQYKKEGENSA